LQLDDICALIVDCEHKTAPTQADGYPSIRTPNIGPGYFILDGVNRVSEETYSAWTKRAVPQAGDLIMAREAPVGNVAMVPPGLRPCLGQRTLLIRPDARRVDPRFLTYLLVGPQVQGAIHAKTNGATVPHLNMKDVRALQLPPLPPIGEQRRIASILSTYDDLIENCQRRIRILEDMARGLYREWFVHFRFPGADALPRVDSPLGPIPQGWKVTRIGALAEEMRRNVAKGELIDSTPYVGLEHIPRRSLALGTWDEVTALGSNKLAFERNEVLFGKIRPYFHKVSVAPFAGVCSADTIVIRPRSPEAFGLVVAVVSSDEFVAQATATSNGSKMPRANWSVLRQWEVAVPDQALLARFDVFVRSVVSQQQVLVAKMRNLRCTRDLLLPRLLSGQITLPNAEDSVPT
jgi:type I restriction enzyme S subunit